MEPEPSTSPLEQLADGFARWAGSGFGFLSAAVSILLWFIAGKAFAWSVAWEGALEVYVGIVTFLALFLMQRAQRKDVLALHLKLNELIASSSTADNHLINIEEQTEDHMAAMHDAHGHKIAIQDEDPAKLET